MYYHDFVSQLRLAHDLVAKRVDSMVEHVHLWSLYLSFVWPKLEIKKKKKIGNKIITKIVYLYMYNDVERFLFDKLKFSSLFVWFFFFFVFHSPSSLFRLLFSKLAKIGLFVKFVIICNRREGL